MIAVPDYCPFCGKNGVETEFKVEHSWYERNGVETDIAHKISNCTSCGETFNVHRFQSD